MARLPIITEEMADEQTKQIYDAIKSKFGMVPNIFKGLANSSIALGAFLNLDEMISKTSFTPVEQDIARLVVSQYNGCRYWLAAHTGSLSGQGLTSEEIVGIRKGNAEDPKHAALINFTLKILETKGNVSDSDLQNFKDAGFSNAHAAEVTVIIAQKMMSNLFNHINDTDIDLPAAPEI
jgi:uncharacterized peroxidase-related enzyme